MTEITELLPCPLCGGKAERRQNPTFGDMSMAHCITCGASAYDRKWNTRAALSSRSAEAGKPVVKALEWSCSPEWKPGEFVTEWFVYSLAGHYHVWCDPTVDAELWHVSYPSGSEQPYEGTEHANIEAAKAAAQADYESRILSALSTPADIEPVAWLRHGEMVPIQGCPLGAMWITDKDDPRGFPVYASPSIVAPVADIEPVSVPDGNDLERARQWLRKRWCQEHPNEGHVKMLAEYSAAPHPTKTEAVDANAVIERLTKALKGLRSYFLSHGWDEDSLMIDGIDTALKSGRSQP